MYGLLASLVNGAVFGGSAGATSTWVNRKMQPPTSTPVGTTQIGEVTLTLLRQTVQARTWYELYVVTPGRWLPVGSYAIFPQAQAAVQEWKSYLENGGTVQAWLTHTYQPPLPVSYREGFEAGLT
jgi:hypothetical protein